MKPVEEALKKMLDTALDSLSDLALELEQVKKARSDELHRAQSSKERLSNDLTVAEQTITKLKIALDAAQEKANA